MKKLVSVLLTVVIVITSLSFSFGVSAEDTGFSGTKKLVYSIDVSDMNNYFNGGRSAFDILLRSYAPDWLKYSVKSSDLDLQISLEYSFVSYEDFCSKTSDLIGGATCIEYKKDKSGTFYFEGHTAADILSFVCSSYTTLTYEDFNFEKLFKIVKNETVINGETFSGENQIVILPNDGEIIQLNSLDIKTQAGKDGKYVRTIKAVPADYEMLEKLKSRFEFVGDVESEGYDVSVTFDASNQADIIRNTILCLYVPCTIKSTETAAEGLNVGVTQTEDFSLDVLMAEYSSFAFEYEYPKYYDNIKSDIEGITVQDGVISTQESRNIQYYYEREFSFPTVDIKTDLSDLFGKMKKSVTFIAPISKVAAYHDELKAKLEKHLDKGVTLNIYNNGINRHYELTYSSWFLKDLNDFTESIIGDAYSVDIADSWLPYGKSTISEKIDSMKLADSEVPCERVTFTYVFPTKAKYQCNSDEKNVTVNDELRSIVCTQTSDGEVVVEYHRFHILKNIVQLVVLIVFIILVVCIVKLIKKIKNRPKKKREKVAVNNDMQPAVQIPPPQMTPPPRIDTPPQMPFPPIVSAVQAPPTPLVPQSQPIEKKCKKCGAALNESSDFCMVCGAYFLED